MLFVPAGFFGVFAVEAGDYPLSFDSAPLVGGKFIYQLPKGQTILMEPSKAGYLAWKVYPKHKIFMDLELALFDDAIAFEAATFLYKPTVLLHHVERYKPSVIYLPLSGEKLSAFKTALQGYRPVFFDKFGIIYLRQDVACTFPSLSHLEMILSQQIDKSRFTPEEQEKFVADIERIASFDAKAFRAHVVLGNTYVAFGQPDKLLQTAETLLRHFPHQIAGYVFKAQALFLLGKNEEAVNYFKQAESKKGDFDRKVLGKNYYVALVALKRFEEAYEVLKKSFNPFYRETPYDILYEFAIGAVNARQYKDAKQFIDIALLATPNEDVAKRKELLRLRGVLHANSAEFQ